MAFNVVDALTEAFDWVIVWAGSIFGISCRVLCQYAHKRVSASSSRQHERKMPFLLFFPSAVKPGRMSPQGVEFGLGIHIRKYLGRFHERTVSARRVRECQHW